MKKIIVAGHICLDISPSFPNQKVKDLGEILLPGKLIEMGNADVHTGGAVANTGLALKFFGADVHLMGKVGKDAFGDMIYGILKKHEASDGLIRLDEESTSYSVVLAVPGIDRIFLHNPGANNTFSTADLKEEEFADATLLHFGYPPVMKKMYENNGEELLSIMKKAKKAGLITSLDMAAVDTSSAAGKVDWQQILKRVLPYVDIFVPSVEELSYMISPSAYAFLQKRANGRDITEIIDVEKDVKPLGKECMSLGAKITVIKCGALGMYYQTVEKEKMQEVIDKMGLEASEWICKEGFEKSYVPDRIISGTGAGDTSIAAFLAAMTLGKSLENAIQLAVAAGASCITEMDALSGLLPLEVLENKIKSGWEKNNE